MFCPGCQSEWPDGWKVCPKDGSALLRSARIGKYAIEGLLGVGGMGAVYRAVNPDTKGAVAIKVMNPAVASSEALRARFQREAGVVAKLRTSHVTKVYDFGSEADGTLYLVMELLDGHTLREEILPAPDYMDLARLHMVLDGSLKGLAAAHKAGIVHRDLKPDNIYIADTDDGEVPKLLDFGIARVRTKEDGLTRTGSLMGTASYMAPEQVAGAQGNIGPWTDVYAMGGILYECLAGAAAFGGDTVTEVLQRVMRSELVPLASVRAGLPAKVYELVERWMHPDPKERPQDAEAARGQLNAAGLVAPGAAVPPAHKTRPGLPPGSSPGLAHTAAAAVAPPPNKPSTGDRSAPIAVPSERSGPVVIPSNAADRSGPIDVTMAAGAPLRGRTETKRGRPSSEANPNERGTSSDDAARASMIAAAQHATGAGEMSTPPRKRAVWPLFALGGVLVAGGVVAFTMRGSSTPEATVHRDAGVTARVDARSIDAAPPIDAPPPPDPMRSKMIHIAAGDYDVGEPAGGHPDALPKAHVHVDDFWIDPAEMTLGELRAAHGSGGLPKDTPAHPARRIDYATAEAACKALGKRVPTEIEWEVAALTTPNDARRALPAKQTELAPSKRTGDCSPDGLCDMLGSVAEWTSTAEGDKHVVRGASYQVSPDAGWEATIHARVAQAKADDDIGVRCAISKEHP